MKGLTLSVSQLNEYVRKSLAADPLLHGLSITGEVSNFKQYASGHWYFSLKDEEACIACVMFRSSTLSVHFMPENGQQVRLCGSVGLYSKTGSYQFYADTMERNGLGDLYLRFEALKRKLSEEGLFDPALKKPLPLLPRGIGVITSGTGAVIHDIARVSWRRNPGMPIFFCPTKVQGTGAAAEIAGALRLMDGLPEAEVLIVGRGGGSMEDLWAFNEETVARAIAACHKPVISAVGHETDFTIADFVADVRAATPSAAAELAVQERSTLSATVEGLSREMEKNLNNALNQKKLSISSLRERLISSSPLHQSERLLSVIAESRARLEQRMQAALIRREHALSQAALRLRSAGPVETLGRGYAIVMKDGKPIKSSLSIRVGDDLTVRLADGLISATVSRVTDEESPAANEARS